MNLPILILTWKRPDHLKRVIGSLRKIRPKNIYFSCDGANKGNLKEELLVKQTRSIMRSEVDWECDKKYNLSETNLGCRLGVSRGIDWFFKNVDKGIIIEEDCILHPLFFEFAESLLKKYHNDHRIGSISASNLQNGIMRGETTYYFSKYHHCWGWATWKDRWEKYDNELKSWKFIKDNKLKKQIFGTKREMKYWTMIFERLYKYNKPDSWAYRWFLSCQINRYLSIIPNENFSENIGFGDEATNTKKGKSPIEINKTTISNFNLFPIKHPEFVLPCSDADHFTFINHFNPSLKTRIIKKIYEKF